MSKYNDKKIIILLFITFISLIVLIFSYMYNENKLSNAKEFNPPIKEYNITFNTNGGNEIKNIKVTENEKIQKPTDPEKEGYVFKYWTYEDKEYNFDTKVGTDMTLIAVWEEVLTPTYNTDYNVDTSIEQIDENM